MKLTKKQQKYIDILNQKTLTKSDINNLKNLFNRMRFKSYEEQVEIQVVFDHYNSLINKDTTWNITKEHSNIGLNYLNSLRKKTKPNEFLRGKGFDDHMGEYVIKNLNNFKKFEFAGFHVTYQYRSQYCAAPIYNIIPKKGDGILYIAASWQTYIDTSYLTNVNIDTLDCITNKPTINKMELITSIIERME